MPIEGTPLATANAHKFFGPLRSGPLIRPQVVASFLGFLFGDLVSENLIEITVLNWERHNPRKGGKSYPWFKLQNNVFNDEKLFNLTVTDKLVWVFILCQASVKNCPTYVLDCVYAASQLSTRASRVTQSVLALCKSGVISTPFTFINGEQGRLDKNRERIEREKIIHAQPDGRASVSRVFFDLDKIYQLYPRKLGKTRGLAKLKTAIKTQTDYDALTTAVTNYAKASQGTESQFVKHFSTWVSEWRDWIESPEISSKPKSKMTLREYFAEQGMIKNEQRGISETNGTTRSELRETDATGEGDGNF